MKEFWSVIVHGLQTRSMLQTGQAAPSLSSQNRDVKGNADVSVDVLFGPETPKGMESNRVQTIPGKVWFTILRPWGAFEPCFDRSWRPGEIRRADGRARMKATGRWPPGRAGRDPAGSAGPR